MARKPDAPDGTSWLDKLNSYDRAVARRWVAAVGEPRFQIIARTAAAHGRPNHRPKEDNWPAILEAAVTYLSTPNATIAGAVSATLPRFRASLPAKNRFKEMTPARLRRIMIEGLERLTVGECGPVEDEIERRGLEVCRRAPQSETALDQARQNFGRWQQIGLSGKGTQTSGSLEDVRAHGAELDRYASFDRASFDRFARAIAGLIRPDTPISKVAAIYHEFVASSGSARR
ncbi:hypothetical protein [Roseomonas chloroacetimidivorans]|uniref:hypothetical protein n=1 Tax=Roseomonas chloroacetimidivorans TaxID=1766656 RepID=UPI003C76436A